MSAIPLFARESNAALDDLMPWSVKLQEAIRTYEKEKE
jgi:hypothetical protein